MSTSKHCRTPPSLSKNHIDPTQYPTGVAYLDGQFVPIGEAKISVMDFGFLHSDATYDVVHVWDGAFFRLEDHLRRFQRGMQKLHMTTPHDTNELMMILHDCVALSGLRNAYVEIICTRGTSPTFSRDPRDAINRLIAFAVPFGSVANEDQMDRGLHAAISDTRRIPPASVDPTVKNYHWLDLITALYDAYDRGAETVILKDINGNLAEGPGFNLFVIKQRRLVTPAFGVLLGISRQTVFDLCVELSLECSAETVTPDMLLEADEAFVTSTAGGVMPVTKVNNRQIGDGQVGKLTTLVKNTYWRWHDRADMRTDVAYPASRNA